MKFMHISDVHLGVKPDAGKAWSEKRAQDIWDSFAEMIEIAAEESPDFLLISGDLFHKQPLKRELKEVCGLFARIPQTKVLLMAGNHDYIQQNSFYRTCEWPENVCFFPREEVMCFDFPEQNTTVYGLSYWHREIRQALYDEVFPKNTDRINILLAHGGDERHIPFSVEKILRDTSTKVGSLCRAGRSWRAHWSRQTVMIPVRMDTGWGTSTKHIAMSLFIRCENVSTATKRWR